MNTKHDDDDDDDGGGGGGEFRGCVPLRPLLRVFRLSCRYGVLTAVEEQRSQLGVGSFVAVRC